MELSSIQNQHSTNSPSSSSTSSSTPHPTSVHDHDHDPMQSWWESVSKARSRILALSSILSTNQNEIPSSSFSLSSLADSDRPALSLLSSPEAYLLICSSLSSPSSGSGSDSLCQWLYETYISSDPNLRLIVLSFLPLLSSIYLSRLHSGETSSIPSLAGFEAVILAIYSAEAKSRAGKALLVQIPDLSQPSLYHSPRNRPSKEDNKSRTQRPSVGVLSAPLEPQIAVKSTKRAAILGTAFDCYYKQISHMPAFSKLQFCKFAAAWAGQDCHCKNKLDFDGENVDELEIDDFTENFDKLAIEKVGDELKGVRIPVPWEFLQPVLRILGHCLLGPLNSQDVKDAAAVAVRRLYARASHDLVPQAIVGTRSLIQLDKRERAAAKANAAAAAAAAAVAANASSNANTPNKAKKPEILLVSK
ncbi:Hyccin [Melia azedarach]|uniref:Hyccin n=1 Tax=Melia azedarach TaxID=155640 RepID=A0ACC1XZM5_MELAZ|nr:Hyccin [Melia azedarach]